MPMKVDCSKLCPDWECAQPEEFKDIWVVMEADETGINEASLQMLTPAKKIASKRPGEKIVAILVGYNVKQYAEIPIKHGADKVIVVDDERLKTYYPRVYGQVVVDLAKKYKPSVILVSATMRGREMGPYIANTLRTGITADCTDFDVDEKTGDVLMIRPPFAAIMLAYIKTPFRRPQMGTARPNVFPVPPADESRTGEIIEEKLEQILDPGMKLAKYTPVKREEVLIEKAEIIVSVGKGIGTTDGVKLAEKLASLLGGVVAGSRKAVDAGFVPPDRQVGQTGKSVKPVLYIALGISGAAQHMLGVREAGRIVAINIDPEAPIFNQSDYSVVGDYRPIVEALIEEIERLKREGPSALEELLKEE
jgi:electron transfer flavoprotein alpha subunit